MPRPKVVKDYFDNANAVDVHNHHRQGALDLESAWHTKNWAHRLFATLLGVMTTDSFLAYRHFHPGAAERKTSFPRFCRRLIKQLLNYSTEEHEAGPAARLRSSESAQTPPSPPPQASDSPAATFQTPAGHAVALHILSSDMRSAPMYRPKRQRAESQEPHAAASAAATHGWAGSAQRQCSVCHRRRTTFYCVQCSHAKDDIVAVCSPAAGPDKAACYNLHVDWGSNPILFEES